MTLADFGVLAEIASAVAVLVTLIFLTVQTRQANNLARMQTRERMVEMATVELMRMVDQPEMIALFSKPAPLTHDETMRVYFFSVLVMRQREWEWYQVYNGAIAKADAEQVRRDCLEVARTYLGYRRTHRWWATAGRYGFNPKFVAELDEYMQGCEPLRYDLSFLAVEEALAAEDRAQLKPKGTAQE